MAADQFDLRSPTIFALASGRPPAGIAVIRLSGPAADATLTALTHRPLPSPRHASLRRLLDPGTGAPLDEALVLRFPAPGSFTGEDVVELHVHGGAAVVADLLTALARLPGLRPAEPGEFTRRAFDNGRLDLTQVEGLADLVAAETSAQRAQALGQAGGVLRRAAEGWRATLVDLLAAAEADLDFGEEEADVIVGLAARDDRAAIEALARAIDAALAGASVGERIRDGVTIVVAGPPNAGKSSLVNALVRRDVAIVTDRPGTTRDAIEVPLNLDGLPAILIDTAGLRDTDDPIEAEGIARARTRAAAADIVLDLGTGGQSDSRTLRVVAKIDLSGEAPGLRNGVAYTSALTGAGLDVLRAEVAARAAVVTRNGEPALVTQARQARHLTDCCNALRLAVGESDPVLRADALRSAAAALGRLTGRIGVEEVLGSIFGRFCIGK